MLFHICYVISSTLIFRAKLTANNISWDNSQPFFSISHILDDLQIFLVMCQVYSILYCYLCYGSKPAKDNIFLLFCI